MAVARGTALTCATCLAAAGAGCPGPPVAPAPSVDAPRLVVSERGPDGGRLVVVAEDGQRLTDLAVAVDGADGLAITPAFSPDGRWVVYAVLSGDAYDRGHLWVVPARARSTPIPLTDGPAVDLWPAWAPDGRSIVFSSTRGDGDDGGDDEAGGAARPHDLDLWRLPLTVSDDAVAVAGDPVRLTALPGDELGASVAADGRIAFAHFEHDGAAAGSRIAVRAPDGVVRHLTDGPAHGSPAFSPDGTRLAFSAPHVREGADGASVDGDLWVIPADGGTPAPLLDEPVTDESQPVWSADGRWIFATSLFRGADGAARFSSVVYRDTRDDTAVVRMLVDRAGAVPRLSIAVAPVPLDASALHGGPVYRDELAGILRRAAEAAEAAKAAAGGGADGGDR